ncbi:SatD family protein [Nocardioides bruguierae]|uniref:SatD family protein n=1 Tax=Nocardioides bruguierae TaxID=2945102 RepID=A0A9X2D4G2_9ACTN|nr:SatD family protein [Nocardioides bruguierae]MCM0619095.1 SatD family protein [Nocardioides bruguierae]
MSAVYTVIGDLVGSRDLPDRAAAQKAVGEVLAGVSAIVPGVQPFEATVGDEVQGAFATIGGATRAGLLARLGLLARGVDLRCGYGHGEVTVHEADRRPLLQDGPGWWSAREAVDVLGQPRRSGQRSWYVGPDAGRVVGYLLVRDALVDRLTDRHREMLALAVAGRTQAEVADALGLSRSAVSQAFARGVGAVREAVLLLDAEPGTVEGMDEGVDVGEGA